MQPHGLKPIRVLCPRNFPSNQDVGAQKRMCWDFPGGLVVRNSPSSAGGGAQSLLRERRSHMPHGQKNKTLKKKRNTIVTNSIKTFKKWSRSKKKKKLKKRTYDKPGLHPVTWPQDARLAMVSLASPPPPQTSHLTDKHDGGRFYKVL